jgi:hypothetical protein
MATLRSRFTPAGAALQQLLFREHIVGIKDPARFGDVLLGSRIR